MPRSGTGQVLARNTALNLIGYALPLIVAVAALPLVLEGLGEARFGILALAWALLGYVAEIGFGRATTHFVADAIARGEERRLPGIVGGTVLIQAGFGVAAGLALLFATPLLVERALNMPAELIAEARLGFFLMAAITPLVLVSSAFRGVLEAAQRFDLVNAVKVPLGIANFLLPLVAIWLGWRLPGVIALLLAARALSVVAHYVLARRIFPVLRQSVPLRLVPWRELVSFGGWTSVSAIVSPVLVYLDRFMLGVLLAMTAVAYYTVPFEVLGRVLPVLPSALVATLFPAFSAEHGRADGRADVLAARAVKYILIAVGATSIFLLATAEDLLTIWIDAAFAAEAALAMKILAVGFLINALAYVPLSLLQSIGRPDLPAKFHLIELPIQFVLVWFFVSNWGVPGAALAWTARVTIDTTLLYAACARLTGLSARSLAAERVPQTALLLAGLGAIAFSVLPQLPALWMRSGFVIGVLVLLIYLAWHYSFAEADRGMVTRLLRSFAR